MHLVAPDRLGHRRRVGPMQEMMADLHGGRVVAQADAGRPHDADTGAECTLQLRQELFRAEHGAGQAVADPHRERRHRRVALLHDIEMRVEGGDLVRLGERDAHQLGKRSEMRRGDLAKRILDQMEMLDQQVAVAGSAGEQRLDLLERARIHLASLRHSPGAPAAAPRVLEFLDLGVFHAVHASRDAPAVAALLS
jgi:hypothetical protein